MKTTQREKICTLCGEDCSTRPRTKDPRGRYYCCSCYVRERARRVRASSGQTGAAAFAPSDLGMLPMILEEVPQAPRLPQRVLIPCPGCRKPFDECELVCTHCGWDQRRGRRRRTRRGAPKTVRRWKVPASYEAPPFWHPRAPLGTAVIVGAAFTLFAAMAPMSETLALAYFVAYGLFSIALAITILVLAFGESIGTGITMLLCALIVFVLPGVFGVVAWWTFFLIVLLWAWKYRHLFWLLMANIALQFVTLIVLVQLARVATA